MPSTFINPFDFRKILIEWFIGDGNLAMLFLIMIYSYNAAKWGFSNKLYFFFLVIGSIMFSAVTGQEWYTIMILIFGGFVFKAIADYII